MGLLFNIGRKIKAEQKVNLFIVGQRKCGTTSLHSILVENSNGKVKGSNQRKEPRYWANANLKPIDTYLAHYNTPEHKRARYLLDSSTAYTWMNDGIALERIAKYNPEAKILFIIRNPVDRFFSDFKAYALKQVNKYNTLNKSNQLPERRKINEYLYDKQEISLEEFCRLELSENPVFNAIQLGDYEYYINKLAKTGLNYKVLDFDLLKDESVLTNILSSYLDIPIEQRIMEIQNAGAPYSIPEEWKNQVTEAYRKRGIEPEEYKNLVSK